MGHRTAASAFGYIGIVSSLTLFLTPITVFRDVVKKGDVQQYSPVVYLVTWMQCALWTVYGLITPNILESLISTTCGTFLQTIYLCLFFYYSKGNVRRKFAKQLASMIAIFVAVVLSTIFISPYFKFLQPIDPESSLQTIYLGLICVFVNVLMYASPLSVMRVVVRTKSSRFLPIWIIVGSVFVAINWGMYSLLIRDPFVGSPCVGGLVIALVQIALYFIYRDKNKTAEEDQTPTKPEAEIQMAAVDNLTAHATPAEGVVVCEPIEIV